MSIKIADVKLEDQNIQDPSALTIIENKKQTHAIPFDKSIKYKFESVE